jgi:predicted Fe-Mo cluster-binding NifX family protein
MKIAIPEHQGRVAPVFDTCRRMLVFSSDENEEVPVAEQDWSTETRRGRAIRLKELGIDILLCGAISCGIEDQIHDQGICLVAWLAGDVPTILKAYREGRVLDPGYAMPGTLLCRQRRQARRGIRAQMRNHQSGTSKKKEKTACLGLMDQDRLGQLPQPEEV